MDQMQQKAPNSTWLLVARRKRSPRAYLGMFAALLFFALVIAALAVLVGAFFPH
jgi:uncharacterized membrane protein